MVMGFGFEPDSVVPRRELPPRPRKTATKAKKIVLPSAAGKGARQVQERRMRAPDALRRCRARLGPVFPGA